MRLAQTQPRRLLLFKHQEQSIGKREVPTDFETSLVEEGLKARPAVNVKGQRRAKSVGVGELRSIMERKGSQATGRHGPGSFSRLRSGAVGHSIYTCTKPRIGGATSGWYPAAKVKHDMRRHARPGLGRQIGRQRLPKYLGCAIEIRHKRVAEAARTSRTRTD